MKLNQESDDSRSQTLILQTDTLDALQVIFHKNIYSLYFGVTFMNLFRGSNYATQNELMQQASELRADVSVATGAATTSTQVTTSQPTDGWFMSCWSIIITFTTNLISQHMTCRCQHKRYSFPSSALYFCS